MVAHIETADGAADTESLSIAANAAMEQLPTGKSSKQRLSVFTASGDRDGGSFVVGLYCSYRFILFFLGISSFIGELAKRADCHLNSD